MLATVSAHIRAFALAMLLLIGANDAPAQATAQRLPRVGFCPAIWGKEHVFTKVFLEGMRKRGWVDGKNVRIVYPQGSLVESMQKGSAPLACADYMADKDLDVVVGDGFHEDPNYKVPIVTTLHGVQGTALAKSPTRNVTGITNEGRIRWSATR
jgi:hypothetical protein